MTLRLLSALSDLEPRRFFLLAALAGGLALGAATPPFQVPDEPAHFYRAYSVSEGRLSAGTREGVPGDRLPASLRLLVETLTDDVPFHPETKIEAAAWNRAAELQLEPEEREFLPFPTSAHYSALPYLPQAAGITVGRWLGVSPLSLVFFARGANLLVAIALIYLSLRQLPSYRWLAALLALTPMAMFLRSSISADALTTAVAFVFTATVAKLAFGSEPATPPDFVVLITAAAALSLTKPVYFPLVLAALVIPADRLPRRRRRLVVLASWAALISAATAASAIALASVHRLSYITRYRIGQVLDAPLEVGAQILLDYGRHGPRYGAEFIGRLGWLDTPLPLPLLAAYLTFLVAFWLLDGDLSVVVAPWQRVVLALSVVACLLAISLALYVLGGRIGGIQGRYFHPIALAAVWALHHHRGARLRKPAWIRPMGAMLLTALSVAVTLVTLYQRYYG